MNPSSLRELLNYNFRPDDIRDGDYDALYRRRRRDSVFAAVYEQDGRLTPCAELPFATVNAERTEVEAQSIDVLESDAYAAILDEVARLYGMPHGTSTAIGVTSLWMNTAISTEQQVFFGQNTDTMTCSVPAQYLSYFIGLLPGLLQERLGFSSGGVVESYLKFFSHGLLDSVALLDDTPGFPMTACQRISNERFNPPVRVLRQTLPA